mmetsp:Transcript_16672/g.56633  ORF Transcript_16672/g.56633 Transcript_16672/m.56633 type:complete len:200 (-) Transcript_16672:80-679(-)
MNTGARIVCAGAGDAVDPADVLSRDFDMLRTGSAATWMHLLSGPESRSSTEAGLGEAGVASLVYERRRPFHPARLEAFVRDGAETVTRSGGFFWLASQPRTMMLWSQAGSLLQVQPMGEWTADGDDANRASADEDASGVFGDRRQELALMGPDLDAGSLAEQLDACLLTDEEMELGFDAWSQWPDPFSQEADGQAGEDA